MQREARRSTSDTYRKVIDHRKRRVRGLWTRGASYYGCMTVTDEVGRKKQRMVKLTGESLADAKADYARLLTERADNRLRPEAIGQAPTFAEYLKERYLPALQASGKRPETVRKDSRHLNRWAAELGHLRLNKINPGHLDGVLVKLSNEGLHGRTVNLHLIAVRGLFKAAARDRHVQRPLPYEGLVWRRFDRKARGLLAPTDADRLVTCAQTAGKNGQVLADFLTFLRFSGCREKEALALRWTDVSLERGILTIGADGTTKNRNARHLPLNAALRAHLEAMAERRQPDSSFLFPSPQRGSEDRPAINLRATLELARTAAGLPKVAFHDMRHFFASYAVMSGLDFVTVARWLGHRDGGALLARTYAHLAPGHEQAAASKLTFGSAILKETTA